VVEALHKIAGQTDAEISTLLQKELEKKGVDFRLGCKVTGLTEGSVSYERGGESHVIEADKALLSIGRRPSAEGAGLENIGVYVDRGAVVTDNNLRTNIPGVWAAGDVNGKIMLAHTAYREAEVAVNNMLGKRDCMRYHAIPSVIYTNPEAAGVGETERSAVDKGMQVREVRVSMRYSGRYMAETQGGNGICKLVVDTRKNRLVGAHLFGSYASEMIYGVGMMLERGWTIDELKELVFPHPTVCEVIREALFEI
jgi:dihydrolipoamide dehydrogenase